MTTEQKIKEYNRRIKIMEAHHKGSVIQVRGDDGWLSFVKENPLWDWRSSDYRIKPKKFK